MPNVFSAVGSGVGIGSNVLTADVTLIPSDPTFTGQSIWLITVSFTITFPAFYAVASDGDIPWVHTEITGGLDDNPKDDWTPGGVPGGAQSRTHTWSALCRMTGSKTANALIINGHNMDHVAATTLSLKAVQVGTVPDATTTAAKVTVTPGSQLQVSRQAGTP